MDAGMASLFLIALGGALGGMGRFAVSNAAAKRLGKAFPWGTLMVNASGALVAGWLLARYGLQHHDPTWIFAIIGLLGGYTTVSSFSLQTLELYQSGQATRAALNVASTLGLGLLMATLGWWLGAGVS